MFYKSQIFISQPAILEYGCFQRWGEKWHFKLAVLLCRAQHMLRSGSAVVSLGFPNI